MTNNELEKALEEFKKAALDSALFGCGIVKVISTENGEISVERILEIENEDEIK